MGNNLRTMRHQSSPSTKIVGNKAGILKQVEELRKEVFFLKDRYKQLKEHSSKQAFFSGAYIIMALFLVCLIKLVSETHFSNLYMSVYSLILTIFFSLAAYLIAYSTGHSWKDAIYANRSKGDELPKLLSWLMTYINPVHSQLTSSASIKLCLNYLNKYSFFRSLRDSMISFIEKTKIILYAMSACDYVDVAIKTAPIILTMFLVKWYFLGFPLLVFDQNFMFVAFYLFINVPLQELVARGFIQNVLQKLFHEFYWFHFQSEHDNPNKQPSNLVAALAILVANLIFTVAHLHLGFIFSTCSMLCGFVWGYVYFRQQNLIAPIVSHFFVGLGLCLLQLGKLSDTITHLAVMHNQLVLFFSHPITMMVVLAGLSAAGMHQLNKMRVSIFEFKSEKTCVGDLFPHVYSDFQLKKEEIKKKLNEFSQDIDSNLQQKKEGIRTALNGLKRSVSEERLQTQTIDV
ncbi:MAG TPA: CPBP family intramembrane glutamic endopeptidase [Gammaproteobacteria bacterium]|nr:CPBP family intramembrane glutamic endopeptidase [Gammaproteobacteria bacterium]